MVSFSEYKEKVKQRGAQIQKQKKKLQEQQEQVQSKKEAVKGQRQKLRKAKESLPEFRSAQALRGQKFGKGRQGRLKRRQIFEKEQDISQKRSILGGYLGQLKEYETEKLQPAFSSLQKAESKVQKAQKDIKAYEKAKSLAMETGEKANYAAIAAYEEGGKVYDYYKQFKRSQNAAEEAFLENVQELKSELPEGEKLQVDYENMRVEGVESQVLGKSFGNFEDYKKEYNKAVKDFNKNLGQVDESSYSLTAGLDRKTKEQIGSGVPNFLDKIGIIPTVSASSVGARGKILKKPQPQNVVKAAPEQNILEKTWGKISSTPTAQYIKKKTGTSRDIKENIERDVLGEKIETGVSGGLQKLGVEEDWSQGVGGFVGGAVPTSVKQGFITGLTFGLGSAVGAGARGVTTAASGVSKGLGTAAKVTETGAGLFLGGKYVLDTAGRVQAAETPGQKGEIIGGAARGGVAFGGGYAAGRRGFDILRGEYLTRGRPEIPIERAVPESVRSGRKSFPEAPPRDQLSLFRSTGRRYPELGGEPGAFHAYSGKRFGRSIIPETGRSELPGLYGSSYVSPHFLRLKGSSYKALPSLRDLYSPEGSPGIAYLKPRGFRRVGYKKALKGSETPYQFKRSVKEGYADIPGMKSEIEAIYRPGSGRYIKEPGGAFIRYKGVKVPVDKFRYFGESAARGGKGTKTFSESLLSYSGLPKSEPIISPGIGYISTTKTKKSELPTKEVSTSQTTSKIRSSFFGGSSALLTSSKPSAPSKSFSFVSFSSPKTSQTSFTSSGVSSPKSSTTPAKTPTTSRPPSRTTTKPPTSPPSRTTTPSSPGSSTSSIPSSPPLRPGKRQKGRSKGFSPLGEDEDFSIYTRRGGKDYKVGEAENKQSAISQLRGIIDSTLRASGYIEREGKKVPVSLGQGYRRSKQDPFRVVEKRSQRLNKKSEVSEILSAKKNTPRKPKKSNQGFNLFGKSQSNFFGGKSKKKKFSLI